MSIFYNKTTSFSFENKIYKPLKRLIFYNRLKWKFNPTKIWFMQFLVALFKLIYFDPHRYLIYALLALLPSFFPLSLIYFFYFVSLIINFPSTFVFDLEKPLLRKLGKTILCFCFNLNKIQINYKNYHAYLSHPKFWVHDWCRRSLHVAFHKLECTFNHKYDLQNVKHDKMHNIDFNENLIELPLFLEHLG